MTVYLVGAGPGDPGLLTRHGAELLGRADVVVYDRLVDPSLLELAPPGAELVDVGKRPAVDQTGSERHGASAQREINDLLVERGRAGRTVVRLKGGDPFLFGRGGEEAEALAAAGLPWEVVPGVSSALAVPAYAGVPVTHRGLSTSVTVVTGHADAPGSPGAVDWESLARAGGTLVVLMGMANRAEIARRLGAAGRPADTPVALVEWGTTPAQRTVRTTLSGLAGVEMGAPAVIVIGPVAALDLVWADTTARPLAGLSVVVTRPRHQAGPLGQALADAGARVVTLALLEVDEPDDGGTGLHQALARVAAGHYDWVVLTSANAVARFAGALRDARDLGATRLAAVGPGTAAALAGFRLVADLVPPTATAAGLVAAFPAPGPGGTGRVLFPASARARPTLATGLARAGWAVDQVVAYRTVPAPPPAPALARAASAADAVVFASPSALEAYVHLAQPPGTGAATLGVPPVVACIGPVTAEAARRAGLAVAVESPDPSPASLVAALAAHRAAARAAPHPGRERSGTS